MSDFLNRLAASSRARAQAARHERPESELIEMARRRPDPPALALHPRFDLIAEIKFRSPAEGTLGSSVEGDAPAERAAAYTQGGAAALSVLTEPTEFGGTLEDLAAVAEGSERPVMRKDFIVDSYQVLEARAQGAAGVLLIARILSNGQLDELAAAARELGLFVLAEAFDEGDLERIGTVLGAGTRAPEGAPSVLVGVNTRDLSTLAVDPGRLARVRPALPEGSVAVAESGITDAAGAARAARLGYRMALVGSALMRSRDPRRTVAELLAAGRGEGGA